VIQYTETVATTTGPTPIFEVVRGTADWFARLSVNGIALPSGNAIAFRALPIIGTSILAALGLAGLCHRRLPERRFIVIIFLLGVLAVGGGFAGIFASPLSEQYRWLLTGPLAVFRNIYKFQAWVTLPVALGVIHALSRLADVRLVSQIPLRRMLVASSALLVVFAGAYPLWNNMLMKGKGFTELPAAWTEARDFLDRERTGRVLVVPGLGQQEYDWGYTQQLAIQWSSDIAWAVRSQAPLGGPGNIAYLDAIERALSAGGDPALVSYLQRGGFSQVLVAADTAFRNYGAADPQTMFDALEASGLEVEASFGDAAYGFGDLHQIEIFAVPDPEIARTYAMSSLTWLSGDTESTMKVPESLFGDRPYLLTSDPQRSSLDPSQWIITDGNQRYATNFGRNRNNRSYVLGPFETLVNGNALSKLQLRPSPLESQTVMQLEGISSLRASSVGPGIIERALADSQPANVLDGDPSTSWRPNRLRINQGDDYGTADQWIDIEFETPRVVEPLSITLLLGLLGVPAPIEVTTLTDNGSITTQLEPVSTAQTLAVATGVTNRLRVSISRDSFRRFGDLIGISELSFPGTPVTRSLRVPNDLAEQFSQPGSNTPAWVFSRDPRSVGAATAPIIREFTVPAAASLQLSVSGSVSSSPAVLRLINRSERMDIASNSTLFDAPGLAPRNLIDDDPSTFWLSAIAIDDPELSPQITISWLGDRAVSQFRLGLDPQFATPASVTITVNGEVFERPVASDGSFEIPERVTTAVLLDLRYAVPNPGEPILGAGLTAVDIDGIAGLYPGPVDRNAPLSFPCGVGPGLTIDGERFDFAATTTYGDLIDHQPAALTPCNGTSFDFGAGDHHLEATDGPDGIGFDQIILGTPPTLAAATAQSRSLSIGQWGSTSRTASIGAGEDSLFVVNEVFNRGWQATLDGVRLEPILIDGWRQAFIVPAGSGGTIDLAFTPNSTYQAGIAIGILLLLALALLALIPRRRFHQFAPVGVGTWSTPLLAAAGIITAIGTTGIGAIALGALWALRRRIAGFLPLIAFVSYCAAGALAVMADDRGNMRGKVWGVASYPVSALAALAVVCVICSFVMGDPPRNDEAPTTSADEPPKAP
jgi:arabinofuranan 3-O-arabinosyltransferase